MLRPAPRRAVRAISNVLYEVTGIDAIVLRGEVLCRGYLVEVDEADAREFVADGTLQPVRQDSNQAP